MTAHLRSSLIINCSVKSIPVSYSFENSVVVESLTYHISLVLKILYPDAVKHHNYSKTLTSVAFAGTIVGMLVFGYISDKVGRKFGMVRTTVPLQVTHR